MIITNDDIITMGFDVNPADRRNLIFIKDINGFKYRIIIHPVNHYVTITRLSETNNVRLYQGYVTSIDTLKSMMNNVESISPIFKTKL